MAHDGDDRRTRLQVLVLLQLLVIQVDVELLQQLLVLLFGGHDLDVPADFLAEDLEGRLVERLRGRGHLAEMEQHGDQRGLVDVDLLRQIGQRGALTQLHGLAVAGRDAHAADDRSLQLLELLTLRKTVLAGLRGLAALTSERACGAAAASAAAGARGTVARRAAALIATLAGAAEAVAALTRTTALGALARTTLSAALTRTVMAPLAGTRCTLRTLARTTAETAAALARTAATAATLVVVRGGAGHRMRTRDVTRRRRMHALLAAERIVARTRPRRGLAALVLARIRVLRRLRAGRVRHRAGRTPVIVARRMVHARLAVAAAVVAPAVTAVLAVATALTAVSAIATVLAVAAAIAPALAVGTPVALLRRLGVGRRRRLGCCGDRNRLRARLGGMRLGRSVLTCRRGSRSRPRRGCGRRGLPGTTSRLVVGLAVGKRRLQTADHRRFHCR